MAQLTTSDLADLAEGYADVAWAVYVQGLDEVFTHELPDAPADAPGNRALDRVSAMKFAEQVAEDSAALVALHGGEVPELVPFVLCHGIVWTER